ncbi:MAG: dihydrofolate reductase [Actinobacteria bacterium]|nr:dihydrofolate reductase [Actinomycetota bacterium]
MTRAIFYTASTLNGFLATADDDLGWLLSIPQDDAAAGITDFLERVGVLVEGSATYEWVLRHEELTTHPERWQEFYGERPTFVFTSRTLPGVPGADFRFVHGSVAEHWAQVLDAAAGKDVWIVGGGELAGQFIDAGLLTDLVITVAPATLTGGKPLLPRDLDHHRLELTGVRQIGAFAELTYRVNGAAAEG